MRIIKQKSVKARKEYKCKICGKDIKVGERYKNTRFVSEDNNLGTCHIHDICYHNLSSYCADCELVYIDGHCSNECEENIVW